LLRQSLNWLLSRKRETGSFEPKDYPRYEATWPDVVSELKSLGIELMLKDGFMPDFVVSYTDKESWDKIIPYLTFPADMYVDGDADCDDYSKLASAKSAMSFKRNGCFQVWGDSPNGYHAFNIVKTEKSYMLFEPNAGFKHTGELFRNGQYGYLARSWK